MGVHQDKDERPETIAAGDPDRVGVARRRRALRHRRTCRGEDPTSPLILRSGDVLVMGGPSRLRYHGVTRILPGTAPEGTGPGRFNLTFRQCLRARTRRPADTKDDAPSSRSGAHRRYLLKCAIVRSHASFAAASS